MPFEPKQIAELRPRLDAVVQQGHLLESEGLPFPTEQVRAAFEEAALARQPDQVAAVLKRSEALLARVRPDWTWVRELLRRADELRAIAASIGVDIAHLDARVGNPRDRLMTESLSSGSLEKAAASASLSLAVLNDAVPKFCVQEAQQLGVSIRRARDRGEDVREAAAAFSRLVQAIQDQNLPTAAQRLVEARRDVARIPRAPALPPVSRQEEEEILFEARNLARRLQRIKGKARNAQSAARLMAQVRAAISEERRYGTPQEEIEELWLEVDRLTREKKRSIEGPPLRPPPAAEEAPPPGEEQPVEEPEGEPPEEEPEEAPQETPPEEGTETAGDRPLYQPSLYVPYVPPDPGTGVGGNADDNDAAALNRGRSRPRPRP